MINLLIADDHQIFRQGVRRLLSDHEDLAVVAEAGNYAEVLKALHEFRVDVVVVEISRELSLSEKTVSTHKAHVLRKMSAENASDLVRYAVRHHLVAP